MTNAELIMGLRWCADESICCDDFSGEKCPYFDAKKDSCSADEILHAAADALEAADKRIDVLQKLVDVNTERCEALRKQLREAHESYEKHINELTTKCNQLQAAVDNYEKRIAELEAQMPKEGEWIDENRRTRSSKFVCSTCKRTCYDIQPTRDKAWTKRCRYNYCPNCGARMDAGADGERRTDEQ